MARAAVRNSIHKGGMGKTSRKAKSNKKTTVDSRAATPLMRQYYKIKDRHPNAILLFRMGDFYETFEEDAKTVSQVLGITLTQRSNGKASNVALAGFPHHALDNYLPKLVKAGLRVAVCEQLEDPKMARKIVKRGVVEIVTPGVSFHEQLLDPKRSNYLAAIHWGKPRKGQEWVGFSFLDASTGEFFLTEVPAAQLQELVHTIAPAEILVDKRRHDDIRWLRSQQIAVSPQEDWCFGYDFAYESLLRHFKTHSLKGFGIEAYSLGIVAAGAALYYLGETQKGRLPHISRLNYYASDQYMALDPQTKRNLELVASMQDGRQEGTLIQILDHTKTPMGARLLRKWLQRPLRDVGQIQKRLNAVEGLVTSDFLRGRLREILQPVGDLERLAARVSTARATPRDLVSLLISLKAIPVIKETLRDEQVATLRDVAATLTPCNEMAATIRKAIVDEPPAQLADGGFIRDGYNAELDELRVIQKSGKDWIVRLQKEEAERTGITSLKVGFNKVFGYYLEVTNAHKDKVPDDFIRKQTLVNAERYITPQLKEYEEKILTASEKITHLEAVLFQEVRDKIALETDELQHNATLVAMLDCFGSLAEAAVQNRYVRPEVHEGRGISITEGRHPVVEKMLEAGDPFISNSVALNPEDAQILIITGPNMAGKSVILRQTGLICLLAQVGAFVPAEKASIGLIDRIFTRVGASDNLASGESTFLVEMNEAANILNNASAHSLILLDEVGRGTSTFDGLSIAWALVEFLHENPHVAAQTLFATHYHELNELADRYNRIVNLRVQVKEHNGKVIFLRKLISGGADHSYGIEVARMAGLPQPLIERAQQILKHLEAQQLEMHGSVDRQSTNQEERKKKKENLEKGNSELPSGADRGGNLQELPEMQLSLFQATDPAALEAAELIRALEPNSLTPVEALLKLVELKRILE